MSVGDFFAPEDGQRAGPDLLREFVASLPVTVSAAIQRIVPDREDLRAELATAGWRWIDHLWTGEKTGLLDRVVEEVTSDLVELETAISQASDKKEFGRAKHFQQVIRTVRSRPLLGFLGSRSILPKYGFPTDVVELRTNHLEYPEAQRVELQRDLRIAISEYAPGGEVVAAKRVWVSGGINRPPNRMWDERFYVVCPICSRFQSGQQELGGTCIACGGNLAHGRRLAGQFIRPEFGFLAEYKEPRLSGESRPQRLYSSRVYFSEYRLPEGVTQAPRELQPVAPLSNDAVQLSQRYSRYGWLALVNAGPLGRGFRVCFTCGFAEPVPFIVTGQRRQKPKPHKNPKTGRDCSGLTSTRHLGHEFGTDVLELRFTGFLANDPDYTLWYSTMYALLEGASDTLGIRRDDLDGTLYRHSDSPIPAIILYDNVPGGAGHVRRISEELPATLKAAWTRMARECCGEDTSCYECLRNFRNQPFHDQLKRSRARDYLGRIIEACGLLELTNK